MGAAKDGVMTSVAKGEGLCRRPESRALCQRPYIIETMHSYTLPM